MAHLPYPFTQLLATMLKSADESAPTWTDMVASIKRIKRSNIWLSTLKNALKKMVPHSAKHGWHHLLDQNVARKPRAALNCGSKFFFGVSFAHFVLPLIGFHC